jgi:hypothetical protein
MRAIVASICIGLALSACATTSTSTAQIQKPTAPAVVAANDDFNDWYYCDWEHRVGTNIRQRVCWDPEELNEVRQLTQTWMDAFLYRHVNRLR